MKVKTGDHVAFNTLADATWFEVIAIGINKLTLEVREVNTQNAPQRIDRSYVKQVKK